MGRPKRRAADSPDSAGAAADDAPAPPADAMDADAGPRKRRQDGDSGTVAKRARVAAATPTTTTGRPRLALALPGSAADNAQSPAAAAALAATLARAAAVFCVDEVIVFDDSEAGGRGGGGGAVGAGAALTARVLQYLETPQYLRRALIPMHPDLRAAGALPPLDAPHHARADEWTRWRDGAVVASDRRGGSVVDVGLDAAALVPPPALRPGARVTLRMGDVRMAASPLPAGPLADAAAGVGRGGPPIAAALAAPREPVDAAGLYWGYTVRLVPSLAAVLSDGGYDWTVGTSERGRPVADVLTDAAARRAAAGGAQPFTSALVVVGGPRGLEAADAGAPTLFNEWVNTCPGQGSRTIRTEEATLVSLAALAPALERGVVGGFT